MENLAFYMHAGSGNHGCEAIVDSLVRMLPELGTIRLVTNSRFEDTRYLPEEVQGRLSIEEEQHIEAHFIPHVLYYGWRLVSGDRESFLRYRLRPIQGKNAPKAAVSIGGDNYCYPSMVKDLMLANAMLNRQGTKTMLLGCSIEPDLLRDKELLEDLKRYRKILARESITYEALKEAGIDEKKLMLVPDPAFTLPSDETDLPYGMQSGNAVGVNVSPMALDYAGEGSTVLDAYEEMIRDILANTAMQVVLIPHVVWNRSDDRKVLRELKERFAGEERVIQAGDACAEKLKGTIANCRFFVGARTHATIAAYSTIVPTLVAGYSVKARGIAKDLFGETEHYVVPVQELKEKDALKKAFRWLYENEDEVRGKLALSANRVRREAAENGAAIRSLLREE